VLAAPSLSATERKWKWKRNVWKDLYYLEIFILEINTFKQLRVQRA
jgi:hypothetical protein